MGNETMKEADKVATNIDTDEEDGDLDEEVVIARAAPAAEVEGPDLGAGPDESPEEERAVGSCLEEEGVFGHLHSLKFRDLHDSVALRARGQHVDCGHLRSVFMHLGVGVLLFGPPVLQLGQQLQHQLFEEIPAHRVQQPLKNFIVQRDLKPNPINLQRSRWPFSQNGRHIYLSRKTFFPILRVTQSRWTYQQTCMI